MTQGKGFTLWLTGLSGAGKSTLATELTHQLRARGVRVEVLDGDQVRTNLSAGLGFSKADRDTNIRRIGYVCRLLSRNGVVAIAAAISPYRETRAEVKRLVEQDGVDFIEVFVQCSIDVLAARDTKGLYQKALAGEISGFTGVDDPYEAPLAPDVVIESDRELVELSTSKIINVLEQRELVPKNRSRIRFQQITPVISPQLIYAMLPIVLTIRRLGAAIRLTKLWPGSRPPTKL